MEEPLRKLNRCGSRNLGILKPEAGEELLQGIKRRIITLQKIADGEPRLTQIPQNLFRVPYRKARELLSFSHCG